MTEDEYVSLSAPIEDQRKALIAYLTSKITAGDWHAVQDAASDIRELEAQLDLLQELVTVHE